MTRKSPKNTKHPKTPNKVEKSSKSSPPQKGSDTDIPAIWFKLTYSLASMHLCRVSDAPQSFPLPQGKEGEIVLWMRSFPPEKKIESQLCCSALFKRTLKPDLMAMFRLLSNGFLPQDKPARVELPYHLSLSRDAVIDESRKIPEKWVIPISIMPKKFEQISGDIHRELASLIHSIIKTLRWVQGTTGKQNPFASVDFEWSFDKNMWHIMPQSFSASVMVSKGIDLSKPACDEVKKVWISGNSEPLAHELIREAFDIVHSNPRSALLIGCSALENGLKSYIHFLVPNSNIILEKIPSPPALTMAQDVIPQLQKTRNIAVESFSLDKDDSDYLKKWITQRNQVAHGIKDSVNAGELLEFLNFTRKLLYRLDECRGHKWASSFLAEDQYFRDLSVRGE